MTGRGEVRLDLVLITAPDRLARNYVHQVLLLEELEQHGCRVEFLDGPMSQNPHDQLLLQISGAVAEYERTLLTERMRRGRQRKLEAGLLLPWTRVPYGYWVDPERPRDPAGVRIEESEAAIVREMFAWYAEDSHSFCSLARLLQQRGIRVLLHLGGKNMSPDFTRARAEAQRHTILSLLQLLNQLHPGKYGSSVSERLEAQHG